MTRSILLAAAAMAAMAGPALAAKKWEGPAVQVVLVAGPLAEAEMQERRVVPEQPFMARRLTARKSVTLQSEVVVKFWHRTARFAPGSQLFQASGADGFEVYCGVYDPGMFVRSAGGNKIQYACLQDVDGDSVFDKGFWTPDNPGGAYLPMFGKVISGPDIKVAYRADAEGDRLYFESAIVLAGKGKPGADVTFLRKVRRPGETAWNVTYTITRSEETIGNRTVQTTITKMTSVAVPANALPHPVELAGARFNVLSRDATGATVRPGPATTGEQALDIFDDY